MSELTKKAAEAEALAQALEQGLKSAGIAIGEHERGQLLGFLLDMLETNLSLNLTAITDVPDVILLHVLDSLTLLPVLDRERQKGKTLRFLDLGTGAGFPGMPVKIMRPDLDLTLMDALAKRIRFLERAAAEIGLIEPWRAVHSRGEEAAASPQHREQYDFVTARAVAELRVLCEYALPLTRTGGLFCAMKAECEEELKAAANAIRVLGGEVEAVKRFALPASEVKRTLILIRKLHATARRYPRSNAQIRKNPL